jgi:hypothetical protein
MDRVYMDLFLRFSGVVGRRFLQGVREFHGARNVVFLWWVCGVECHFAGSWVPRFQVVIFFPLFWDLFLGDAVSRF